MTTPPPKPDKKKPDPLDPASSLTQEDQSQVDALLNGSTTATNPNVNQSQSGSTGTPWDLGSRDIGIRFDNYGNTTLQFLGPADPVSGRPTVVGEAYLHYDKDGKAIKESLDAASFKLINKIKDSEFAYYKNVLIQDGLLRPSDFNVSKTSPSFVAAVQTLMRGMAFKNFAAYDAAKGMIKPGEQSYSNLKDFINKEYKTNPQVTDQKTYAAAQIKHAAAMNGISMSQADVNSKAAAVGMGIATIEGTTQQIRDKAKAMYPQYAHFLEQGQDLSSVLSNYVNTTKDILELSDSQIDLSDPKGPLMKVLQYKDSKGNPATMPLYDYESTLKQDPRWMGTKNATETFSNMYDQLKKGFGF